MSITESSTASCIVLVYRNTCGSGFGDFIRNLFLMYIVIENVKFNVKDSTLDDLLISHDITKDDNLIIDMLYYKNLVIPEITKEHRMNFIKYLYDHMKPIIKSSFRDFVDTNNEKNAIHIRTGDCNFIQNGYKRIDENVAFDKLNEFMKTNKKGINYNNTIIITDSIKLKYKISELNPQCVSDIVPAHSCYNLAIVNSILEWCWLFSFNEIYQFLSYEDENGNSGHTSQFSLTAAILKNGYCNMIDLKDLSIYKLREFL